MPMQLQLIPADTRMEASADGASFNISESATRTFLCRLTVTDQIEQESLDVSIWGSADGQTWPKRPLLKLPQQFYRGTTKLVLDLSLRPEVKFIRARWDLNRWRSEEHTSELQSQSNLHSFPTRRSSDLKTAAAVLSRDDEAGPRSLASSRSEVYPSAVGSEPLGKSRADTHVRRGVGPGGNSADVPRNAHKADGPRRRVESPTRQESVEREKKFPWNCLRLEFRA